MLNPVFFWVSILSPVFLIIWVVFIDLFSFVGINVLTNDQFIIIDEILRVSLFLGVFFQESIRLFLY